MFKVTLFVECLPNELANRLVPVGFRLVKGALVWGEDSVFSIVPFGEPLKEPNKNPLQGYRVYFKNSLDGALYLFDMSIGLFNPIIKGVEYNLTEIERSKDAWNFYFKSRAEYVPGEMSGIYKYGNVGVLCMMDNNLMLQVRPKQPKGQVPLNKSLEEIAVLLDKINPRNMDIFEFDLFEEVS